MGLLMLFILLLPLIEIAGFVWIGPYLGIAGTLLVVVCGSLLGVRIIRHEGMVAIDRLRLAAAGAEPPVPAAIDSGLKVLAGILLVVPGLITDVIALLLILPPLRRLWVRLIMTRLSAQFVVVQTRTASPSAAKTIEGEFQELPDPALPPHR